MDKRSCPFCGKLVGITLHRCPYCREAIPQAQVTARSRGSAAEGRAITRRGLLWALLAGVMHYVAGGNSGLRLPFEVPSYVTQYLTPLFFLAGLGMVLYGLCLRVRS